MGACVATDRRKKIPQTTNLTIKPVTSSQSQPVIPDTSISRPYKNLFKTFSDGD